MLDFGSALAGLGQAVEQQRQRKLQQALQALQIRKMMGQPITSAEWQPIAQQIEQQSKALGTPFQLPRQAQMGPAQTQVTPSGGPSFGAGTAQIPPQPTGKTEYAPPRQPIGEMSVKDLVKDSQRLGELAKQFPGIDQATVEEANQNYPEWRFYLRAGTQVGMGQTVGDVLPGLKNDPRAKDLLNQPIPSSLLITDPKSPNFMQPDPAKVATWVRANLEGQPTSTQQRTELGTRVDRLVNAARDVAKGGGSQDQVHNILQRARDMLAGAQKQGVDIAGIDLPTSTDLMGAGTRAKEMEQLSIERFGISLENQRIALERLGITKELAALASARFNLSEDMFQFRIAQAKFKEGQVTPNDRAVLQLWQNALTPEQKAQLAPAVSAVFKKLGLDVPAGDLAPTGPAGKSPQKQNPLQRLWQGIINYLNTPTAPGGTAPAGAATPQGTTGNLPPNPKEYIGKQVKGNDGTWYRPKPDGSGWDPVP